MGKEL